MEVFRDQIEEMVYEQRKILQNYTEELKSSPDGNLMCTSNHGKQIYYHTYYADGKYVRVSLNNKPDVIRALARKEYLSLAVKVLENNLMVLERTGSKLLPGDISHLKEKMKKPFLTLPDEYFFHGAYSEGIYLLTGSEEGIRRHIDWGCASYEKSTFKPEGLRYPTSLGYKVRSKSEQHIVEQLGNYAVPHRYEQILHIGDKQASIDFTFRDCNYEKFYWEHAGMMDDPYYRNRHERKMVILESAGIVPWKNLIVTYDNDGIINVPMIKSIIEHEVIPRL